MYRLLLADDEQIERMVLYKTLQKYMSDLCEIYQAENGREALKIYEEKQIQIAILDIEMPGIDGIQAAEKIRETDPNCCIIFLTAYDEFNYARKAITVRALDYLLKPYQEEELLSVLEMAIQQIDKKLSNEKELPELRDYVPAGNELLDSGQIRPAKVAAHIKAYIREHYMEDISMQQVARTMNYSEAYFSKLFKQYFSVNFTAYLTEYRMEEAKKLLVKPTVNVKNIGEAVGYPDSNYFAKVFRRYAGCTPTEYRIELFGRQGKE